MYLHLHRIEYAFFLHLVNKTVSFFCEPFFINFLKMLIELYSLFSCSNIPFYNQFPFWERFATQTNSNNKIIVSFCLARINMLKCDMNVIQKTLTWLARVLRPLTEKLYAHLSARKRQQQDKIRKKPTLYTLCTMHLLKCLRKCECVCVCVRRQRILWMKYALSHRIWIDIKMVLDFDSTHFVCAWSYFDSFMHICSIRAA